MNEITSMVCHMPIYDIPNCEEANDYIEIRNTKNKGVLAIIINHNLIYIKGHQLIDALQRCL